MSVDAPARLEPRWQPISAIDRRVLGVLGEKGKTTPDAYPMSLNGLRTGCNQKNNRDPVMNVEEFDIEEAIDRLRKVGAVAVVQGSGRVAKYRHYLYEWLGVEKVELAVMIELLLRGAQTEGELRGRAARMDPIPDLSALRPVLESLKTKKLVVSLTPEGRGHMITHNLYLPEELERVRRQAASQSAALASEPEEAPRTAAPAAPRVAAPVPAPTVAPVAVPDPGMRREVDELRGQVGELRSEVEELRNQLTTCRSELERLREALGA